MPQKTCSKCKIIKDSSEFEKDTRVKSGLKAACRKCTNSARQKYYHTDKYRDRHLKQFGITTEDYNQMMKEQDYKCACCGKTEQENKKRLAVDHCHKTGKVRKLLCHHCNIALGLVNDDEDILISLLSYLREFK
jgi:hypothetical protein